MSITLVGKCSNFFPSFPMLEMLSLYTFTMYSVYCIPLLYIHFSFGISTFRSYLFLFDLILHRKKGLKLAKQLEIRMFCAHIFTEICLRPPQHPRFRCCTGWLDLIPTSIKCKTKRGGLCVYVIDAWCSHAVENDDGQCLPWCQLFNLKTILSL